MKLFKSGVIGFIILNYISFGCTKAPSQFAAIPSQSLSTIDRELFTRAALHQSKGQIDSAILLWSKFLKRNPNSFTARNNLGLLYYANDEIVQAIYYSEQGLKLSPDEVQTKKNLVRALKVQSAIFEENREFDEAIMNLRRIIELSSAEEQEAFERQIESLEDYIFEQVKRSSSMEQYQEFLKKYPRSLGNSDEARLWIEKKVQTEKINNQDSLFSSSQSDLKTELK
ncbi:MAG TPA: tetratricopeptide repeat protein [Nitrospinaceae bacterium]|jgi:tetratricopeptide (TPR) repeat protein|nr:tetratricopeptide repeat protein [Nitrospinaceae bacterium]HIL27135.1 tetratricopeptide repeat protein [Nitrospinaceae bacterium]